MTAATSPIDNPAAPPAVLPAVLDDLAERLSRTRAVRLPAGAGWGRGTDADYLADLVAAWATGYDWREHEARIRALPWESVGEGGASLRLIHQRARSPEAPTAVLLHGWPDSVLRFERVLPLLVDINVVVPALPGYPFAPPMTEMGMSATRMAKIIAAGLQALGYDRYVLSGGDIGGNVAEQIAVAHPDRVAALHLTGVPPRHLSTIDPDEVSEPERRVLRGAREWRTTEGGYMHEHATKPHSLAPGLGDSPAGLAAWIVEKLRSWSDCDGDVETVFPRPDLLTWLTAYWVTNTIGTSMSPYFEPTDPVGYVDTPTVFGMFPRDLNPASRALAERFLNVQGWTEHPAGGHFDAWEQPERYVDGVRAALDLA